MNHITAASANRPHGFTLVEMMVAMLIGMVISLAAIAGFSAHSRTVYNQMAYNQSAEDVSEAFTLLSRLIQQSERGSIAVSGAKTNGTCTTDISIDLAVPEGFPVWPNLVAPFTQNQVRISLSGTGVNAHSIAIASAAAGGLDAAVAIPFAGSNTGNNTKITCMSLAQRPNKTYAFSVAGYARSNTSGVTAYEGVILPRN